MKITGVDAEKCSGCGTCVRECVAGRFAVDGSRKARFSDPEHWCIGCGHCVAVCPQDAVCYDGEERAEKIQGGGLGFEDIRGFLLSKRSVRRYKDQDVPGEMIEKILEGGVVLGGTGVILFCLSRRSGPLSGPIDHQGNVFCPQSHGARKKPLGLHALCGEG